MYKDTFWYLIQTFGKYFEKQDTHFRRALPPAKRLAVALHWLAQAVVFLSRLHSMPLENLQLWL